MAIERRVRGISDKFDDYCFARSPNVKFIIRKYRGIARFLSHLGGYPADTSRTFSESTRVPNDAVNLRGEPTPTSVNRIAIL